MRLTTQRFGTVAYESQDTIHFKSGLLDDSHDCEWLLLADQNHPSLYWLQSVTHENRAFPVCAISDGIASKGIRLRKTPELPDWVARSPIVALAPLTVDTTDVAIRLTQPVVIDPRSRQGAIAQASVDQTLQHEWSEKVATLRECA